VYFVRYVLVLLLLGVLQYVSVKAHLVVDEDKSEGGQKGGCAGYVGYVGCVGCVTCVRCKVCDKVVCHAVGCGVEIPVLGNFVEMRLLFFLLYPLPLKLA
jgi:hypothetical protein